MSRPEKMAAREQATMGCFIRRLGLCTLLLVISLALTGCGNNLSGDMTTTCTFPQIRGKCSECKCQASNGACTEPVRCTACRSPYTWNSSGTSQVDGQCSMSCPTPVERPAAPQNLLELNGQAWPDACFNGEEEQHFFVIGDWGGEVGSPPTTFSNRPHRPDKDTVDYELHAQSHVADRMKDIAPVSLPKFVVNVGDNFYPGGISIAGTCNASLGKTDATGRQVFDSVWEAVYKGPGLDGVEWWGVLGNHDYGGYHYNVHWDQNVFYTWNSPDTRWLTPALYWSRRVQFRNFSADFFFVDTNVVDTFSSPDVDAEHNICSRLHAQSCPQTCPGTSMDSPDDCWKFFKDMWRAQRQWLARKLHASDADWQIIVTHYPATFLMDVWPSLFAEFGVDLFISGHTHQQELHYKRSDEKEFGDTAMIISGGGGGITSEELPNIFTGEDDSYGFMDLTITQAEIKVVRYTHGGLGGTPFIRGVDIITPRERRAVSSKPTEVFEERSSESAEAAGNATEGAAGTTEASETTEAAETTKGSNPALREEVEVVV